MALENFRVFASLLPQNHGRSSEFSSTQAGEFQSISENRHITHNSCTEIDHQAFARCHRLLDIDFHDGIGSRVNIAAFYLCRSLRSANLPGVTFIGMEAFEYCSSLMKVKFGNRLVTLESRHSETAGILCTSRCRSLGQLMHVHSLAAALRRKRNSLEDLKQLA
mmetsp:Transcript_16338/g.24255  ORF Transcript_16338/g.24255 Transcript_16338/m.24255 type:complete len:164 (-) Transcript_16338:1916-2407(-)